MLIITKCMVISCFYWLNGKLLGLLVVKECDYVTSLLDTNTLLSIWLFDIDEFPFFYYTFLANSYIENWEFRKLWDYKTKERIKI